ncbi:MULTISPECIES: hypothetical protein [unclassified Streptomyces]|uniref:hypothetical protein n=1 Tax=unclassified Streptomyces TaxID=2593676 RepID=UPI0038240FA7
MSIRADITEMLRAGHSDREIARTLHTDAKTVAADRAALGLPSHKSGVRPASSLAEMFEQRTRPVAGGHLEWTGYRTTDGTPFFRWQKKGYTGGRVAFAIQYGRTPVGYALPGCDYPGCVAPACMEDQPIRDQLKAQMASIFGDTGTTSGGQP